MGRSLSGEVLAAAKSDLKPNLGYSRAEQLARVEHAARVRNRDADSRKGGLEERCLSDAKLFAFAAPVKPPLLRARRFVRAIRRR